MSDSENALSMPPSADQDERYRGLSRRELELRCQMLDVDVRIAMLWREEYRKLMLPARLDRGTTAEPPAPAAGAASGSAAQVTALRHVASPVASAVRQSPLPVTPAPSGRDPSPSACRSLRPRPSGLPALLGRASGIGDNGSPRRAWSLHNASADDGSRAATPDALMTRRRGGNEERRETSHVPESMPGRVRAYLSRGTPSSHPLTGSRNNSRGHTAEAAPVPLRTSGHRFRSRAAVELFLREQGIGGSPLTPRGSALADATPCVSQKLFTVLFGGNPLRERQPPLASGRGNSLCINPIAQPYAPRFPGEPGLLLLAPDVIRLEDKCETFSIFLRMSSTRIGAPTYLRYLGTYTKVPMIRTTLEVDEWLGLPMACRALWLQRLFTSAASDIRAIHARVSIRNQRRHGSPPSPEETDEWLENNPARCQGIKLRHLKAAFESGEEKFEFEVVKFVKYDADVARKIQGQSVEHQPLNIPG